MGVGGVTSSYGYIYNSYQSGMIDSSSWYKNAEEEAKKLESQASSKTSSTSSSSSTNSSVGSTSSTSSFLMGYQLSLEDLEAAAGRLQIGSEDNVFAKYEAAVAENAGIRIPDKGDGASVASPVDKAVDDIVSAVDDFVNKYNDTISYLSKNAGRNSEVAFQLAAFKRAMPTDKTLKAVGMSYDTNGRLQLDKEALKESISKDYDEVKNLIGGQFGFAERVGTKASTILDSPVDQLAGGGTASTGETDSTNGSSSNSSTSSASAYTKASTMSDSFLQFASFAKSGAYNLSNYYAVSMLNILV
ncbi:flagellar filament capping protein FliD [Lachnospiraceae bacterium 62-35]